MSAVRQILVLNPNMRSVAPSRFSAACTAFVPDGLVLNGGMGSFGAANVIASQSAVDLLASHAPGRVAGSPAPDVLKNRAGSRSWSEAQRTLRSVGQ